MRWHLSGHDDDGRDFVMGVYPMLPDETCWFLAADFDKPIGGMTPQPSARRAARLNLPAALERSRSGNGGHVWLFFAEAIPAALARRLGSHLLTETMERRPDIGLDSYDRFFPNQDTLPHGGFGNLIALPLQKGAAGNGQQRLSGRAGDPHADQWAFLSQVRKIDRAAVEEIVRDAERRGRIIGVRRASPDEEDAEPWTLSPSRRRQEFPIAGPLPASLELTLGDQIYIAKDGLPPGLRNQLLRLAAFQNPEFYKAQAMRLPTYDKPRIIGCAEDHARYLGLPRGCLEEVQGLLADLHIEVVIRDERYAGVALDVKFQGELRPEQAAAAAGDAAARNGRLVGHDRLRQDGGRRLADRPARRQYAGPRASPPVAGAMGPAAVGVPRSAAQGDRPHGRRPPQGQPACSTWPSFKAWCARASSRIAWRSTARSSWTNVTTCRPGASSR